MSSPQLMPLGNIIQALYVSIQPSICSLKGSSQEKHDLGQCIKAGRASKVLLLVYFPCSFQLNLPLTPTPSCSRWTFSEFVSLLLFLQTSAVGRILQHRHPQLKHVLCEQSSVCLLLYNSFINSSYIFSCWKKYRAITFYQNSPASADFINVCPVQFMTT